MDGVRLADMFRKLQILAVIISGICYYVIISAFCYHKLSSVIIFVTQEEIIYDHLTEVSPDPGKHNRMICEKTPNTGTLWKYPFPFQ